MRISTINKILNTWKVVWSIILIILSILVINFQWKIYRGFSENNSHQQQTVVSNSNNSTNCISNLDELYVGKEFNFNHGKWEVFSVEKGSIFLTKKY